MAVCAGSPQPVSDGNSRKQRIFQGIFASLIANPSRKRGARAVSSSLEAQIGPLLTGNVSGGEQGANREWNRDGSFGNPPDLSGYASYETVTTQRLLPSSTNENSTGKNFSINAAFARE